MTEQNQWHGRLDYLARQLGISSRHMSRIIQRRSKPSLDLCERLEKVTGVPRYAWLWPDEYDNPIIESVPIRYIRGHIAQIRRLEAEGRTDHYIMED